MGTQDNSDNIESQDIAPGRMTSSDLADYLQNFLSKNPQILRKVLVIHQQSIAEINDHDYSLDPEIEEIIKQITQSQNILYDVGFMELKELLISICVNWRPIPRSPIEIMLLERHYDGTVLKYHEIISNILSYLDTKSIITFSLCSQATLYATTTHINKILYNLPFNKAPISTNIKFWKQAIDFFFNHAVTLVSIDRNKHSSVIKQLNINKSLFPITPEATKSHIYTTFDYLQPHYIVYCNHNIPMSHTSSVSNSLDCNNKASTQLIKLSDFVLEYKQRIQIKDDSLVWGFHSEQITVDYVCLLLKTVSRKSVLIIYSAL
ncbi:hypothetical protein BEWA_010020 [Theileria equi strain WA]|uniref:F-box domain-containing protein n=1 Tax=Theileria equi strain WA TaxID=1537102 RepID=L0B266_THEEQ|nr:hypothetical protein BEWA_010020 [Theileria equi strain WA]AFZ81588.1 hypothetical protein BEWA_010020 [Theileria equi strain WA]|eukprot:XP_004831254.1 hypothetical protein BEWA_010020 [Theileria equi strain WA]